MNRPKESASALIDGKVKELGDWRGKTLAKVREIILAADPEIVEEWKWAKAKSPGVPVWSHGGIVCTGETYKSVVKMTFARGAALEDPSGLFNSSLEGNARRAIDIHEGEAVNEAALKGLIRAAVAFNLMGRSQSKPAPKPRRAGGRRRSRALTPHLVIPNAEPREAEGSRPARAVPRQPASPLRHSRVSGNPSRQIK